MIKSYSCANSIEQNNSRSQYLIYYKSKHENDFIRKLKNELIETQKEVMSLKSANEALKQEKSLALYERDCYAEKAIKLNCDFELLSTKFKELDSIVKNEFNVNIYFFYLLTFIL